MAAQSKIIRSPHAIRSSMLLRILEVHREDAFSNESESLVGCIIKASPNFLDVFPFGVPYLPISGTMLTGKKKGSYLQFAGVIVEEYKARI